eukprot:389862_1
MSTRFKHKKIPIRYKSLQKHLHESKTKRNNICVRLKRQDPDCIKLSIVAYILSLIFTIIMVQHYIHYSYDWNANHFIIDNIHNHTQNTLFSFWNCFTNGIDNEMFDNGYQCILDNNTIILNHEIGRGGQGAVYSININYDNSSQYALKHSYAKDICYHLRREWMTIKLIQPNQHILSLHHKLSHFYECTNPNVLSETHCFIILEFIDNSVTMFDLLEYNANRFNKLKNETIQKLQKLNSDNIQWMNNANELLKFVLSCYKNIKNTLDALSNEFIYYSDELIHNVLFNLNNNKCFLIDFGLVAEMRDTKDIYSTAKHLDHKLKYSPYSAYFLKTFESRNHVMNSFMFEWKGVKQLQSIANWNKMHKVAAFALRIFVNYYCDIIRNNKYDSYLNESFFNELNRLKDKIYNVDKARKIEAHHFWTYREKIIIWIKQQIIELNEKYKLFNNSLTAVFFGILNDIDTQKTMYSKHTELMTYLVRHN